MASAPRPFASTVLVVEDDVDVRAGLADLLEGEGYHVIAVGDGSAALEYLRSVHALPRVIVLDMMMPVMDGFQFRAEQQRDIELARIPIIVLSAYGDVKQSATSIRADAYLVKPVEGRDLVRVIEHVAPTPSV